MSSGVRSIAVELESKLPKLVRRLFPGEDELSELPLMQLRAMRSLEQAGRQSIGALAESLPASLSSATQIVNRLEAAGLVQRSCDEHDARIKLIDLTSRGRDLMSKRHSRRAESAEAFLRSVPPELCQAFHEIVIGLLEKSENTN